MAESREGAALPLVRRPACRVVFLGEDDFIPAEEQLLSVTTQKALNQPTGMFEVVLVPGVTSAQSEIDLQFHRSQTVQRSGAGANLFSEAYLLEVLRPMMLVQVRMGRSVQAAPIPMPPDASRFTIDPDQDPTLTDLTDADREVVMLGLIDSVTLDRSMTPQGPRTSIIVRGRDLGRVFTDDTHYVFPFPMASPGPNGKTSALVHYPLNARTEDINRLGERYFVRTSEAVRDAQGRPTSWRSLFAAGTVGSLFRLLHKHASALDVELKNQKNLREYLPMPAVSAELDAIPYNGANMMFASGPMWQMFQRLAPTPFGEMCVDTVGRVARLFVRRPPWGRDVERSKRELAHLVATRPAQLALPAGQPPGPADDALFTRDEVTTGRTRLYATLPYHTIKDREILGMQVTKSDREVVNFYCSKAGSQWAGSDDPFQAAGMIAPILDTESVRRYGLRLFEVENPWWNPRQGAGYSTTRELAKDNLRLYFYFKDLPAYYDGRLVLATRPDIRIGDYVYIESQERIFYVEAVTNSWTYGHQAITELAVTRGQERGVVSVPPTIPVAPPGTLP